MANLTGNLILESAGTAGPAVVYLPAKAVHIYRGGLVSQNSSGYVLPYSASGADVCIGVATMECDNSAGADGDKRITVETNRIVCLTNGTSSDAFADTDMIGRVVYGTDDHTAAKTSNAQARKPIGTFMGFETDGRVRVLIEPRLTRLANAFQGLADSPATADALRDAIVALFG